MQAHRFFVLLAVTVVAAIFSPVWQLSAISISLVILNGWLEFVNSKTEKRNLDYDKRLKDVEESVRTQSFSKVFK